jgi:hypothetical protein
LGWAHDDDGHFAITDDGFQTINQGKNDQQLIHFIEKDMWKNSLREALDYYLTNE